MKKLNPLDITPEIYLTPKELSLRLRKKFKKSVSIRTLANWRSLGKGPKPSKVGGTPVYRLSNVEKYESKLV